MGERRGVRRELRVRDDLVLPARMHHHQGIAAGGRMPVHALVGDVEALAMSIEKLPQPVGREVGLGIRVKRVVGESLHGFRGRSLR